MKEHARHTGSIQEPAACLIDGAVDHINRMQLGQLLALRETWCLLFDSKMHKIFKSTVKGSCALLHMDFFLLLGHLFMPLWPLSIVRCRKTSVVALALTTLSSFSAAASCLSCSHGQWNPFMCLYLKPDLVCSHISA